MWPLIASEADAVQLVMVIACSIMGTSHLVRPTMWVAFFTDLHAQGHRGVITRTFTLELWPAMLIVALHQVWSGPGIVLTIYGWALLAKVTIAMLLPDVGLRSLDMAQRGDNAFRIAGLLLLAVGASAGAALVWV